VLDYSWHPAMGPLHEGMWFATSCHTEMDVQLGALGGNFFDCSVRAWVISHRSLPGGYCGEDACQVPGAGGAVLLPQEFWLKGLRSYPWAS
jgi:hypothetical protein